MDNVGSGFYLVVNLVNLNDFIAYQEKSWGRIER